MSKLTKSFYFHVNLLFLYKLLNDKTSFARFKKIINLYTHCNSNNENEKSITINVIFYVLVTCI